jgi:outer membrane protein OmpA-like peptidoglycan-associated protein
MEKQSVLWKSMILMVLISANRVLYAQVAGGDTPVLPRQEPMGNLAPFEMNYSIGFNYIEANSDRVPTAAIPTLKQLAEDLLKPPGIASLVIEGHSDSLGSEEYNQALSLRRAQRVREMLISLGLSKNKLKAVGFGSQHSIATNATSEGRALNRRLEFKIQWNIPANNMQAAGN